MVGFRILAYPRAYPRADSRPLTGSGLFRALRLGNPGVKNPQAIWRLLGGWALRVLQDIVKPHIHFLSFVKLYGNGFVKNVLANDFTSPLFRFNHLAPFGKSCFYVTVGLVFKAQTTHEPTAEA